MRTVRSKIGVLLHRASTRLRAIGIRPSPARYWSRRARKFGVRSVLNMGHGDAEIAEVTQRQIRILFPLLQQQLNGSEKTLLDFGCGPGRFTAHLAEQIDGQAVGVDPIAPLLELAPPHPRVEYRQAKKGRIPAEDHAFDVVWICLVLGGILREQELHQATREIRRVLKPGGLLFLAENTTEKPDSDYWIYRSPETYRSRFPFAPLTEVGEYDDLGERITILTGRNHD